MSYSDEDLVNLWQQSGLSQRELAKELGMNFNILHGKIFREQQRRGKTMSDDTQEKIEMLDNINTRSYNSVGRIKTLEQLIEVCKIDLDEWIIERHVINKWEVGAKNTAKNVVIHPLFQVKAWLVKKYPEILKPVISNVEIKSSSFRYSKPKKIKQGQVLVLSDIQFGFLRNLRTNALVSFHDRQALAVVLSLVEYINPTMVAILGDTLDFAEWSDKFIRSPEMYNTTQPALIEASWFLSQIRQRLPKTPIYLLEGNHEGRLTKAINKQVPYAFGLARPYDGLPVLSVPNLLGLEDLGIEYIGDYPKGELWINDTLRAIHGNKVRSKSGATASAVLEDAQTHTIFGHVHRSEMASKTLHDYSGARIVTAFSVGCLCKIDGTVPGAGSKMNWQQGVGLINYDEQFVAITPIPIEQGVAMYDGRHFKGKDYLNKLKSDTGWLF